MSHSNWYEETKELPKETIRPASAVNLAQEIQAKRKQSKYANVQSTVKSYVEGKATAEELKPRPQQPEDIRSSITKNAPKPRNSLQIASNDWRRK